MRFRRLDLGEDGLERVEPRRQRIAVVLDRVLEQADEGRELVVGEGEVVASVVSTNSTGCRL